MTGAPRANGARVVVVGAGLAGCEAALGLAERGFEVDLIEQKPKERTPAQSSDHFSELVCGRGKECGYSRPLEEASDGAGEPSHDHGAHAHGEHSASPPP